ncbi:unnamed protein product [Oikopleura dioica]|uniref:Uncharacterized protein n=1 Tax=Oikopleura dioica TaxID=34765 RepID=E4XHS2_OIKDI|nr:unnamed protein product [Oikopleura dioica]
MEQSVDQTRAKLERVNEETLQLKHELLKARNENVVLKCQLKEEISKNSKLDDGNRQLTNHINHLEESTKTAFNFMKCIAMQAKAEIKQNRAELNMLYKSFHKLAEYDNLQRIELETNITVTDTRVIAAQTELESLQLQISKKSRLSRLCSS